MQQEFDIEIFPQQRSFFFKSPKKEDDKQFIEFEVRLRMTGNGISAPLFDYILQTLRDSSYSSTYEAYEHVSYQSPVQDGKNTDREFRVKKGVGVFSKKLLRRMDVDYLGFTLRASESSEREEVSLPPGLNATFSRYIKRTSFMVDSQHRVDCSEVINRNLQKPKEEAYTSFEIEVENTSDDREVVFYDTMYPTLQKLVKMIHYKATLPSYPIILCQQRSTIQETMVTLERQLGQSLSFDLRGQAINMKRKHFSILNQYALTNKLDGERKMIYLHTDKNLRWAFIMNATGPVYDSMHIDSFLTLSLPMIEHPDVVVDTEYDHGIYYMFDTLFVKDLLVPKKIMPHRKRMSSVQPEWFSFPFQKKNFYYNGNVDQNMLPLINDFPNPSEFFEKNDGFVFTYPAGSYAETNSLHPHLKYKFSSKLSLDFYIVYVPDMKSAAIPYCYALYSNEKQYRDYTRGIKTAEPYGILKSLTPLLNHTVVECLWFQQNWIMYRYRTDRTKGNGDHVIKDVFEDMTNPITVQEMFPFPSLHEYVTVLERHNRSYVYDAFQDTLLSLLYLTVPLQVIFDEIGKALDVPNVTEFYGAIQSQWLHMAQHQTPSDYDILSMISATIKQDKMTLYSKEDTSTIYSIYDRIFPPSTPPTMRSIFDVRSFGLLYPDTVACRSKHGWVQKHKLSVLPPLQATPDQFTRFSERILQANPSYKDYVTVDSSDYSSLKPWEKPQVESVFKKWFPFPNRVKHIVDATAHVGVDTIHMAQFFSNASLDAFEVVPETTMALKKNIATFGLNDRVSVHYQDATTWIPTEHIDLLYIDPPWGGPSYKEKTCLDLYMEKENKGKTPSNHKNVNYIIDQWMSSGNVDHIILKVPSNFTKTYLMNKYKVEESVIYDQSKRRYAYGLLHIQNTIPFLYKPMSKLTVWSVPYYVKNYEPIFFNTETALIRIPHPDSMPKELIHMRMFYYLFQPFSFERPSLIVIEELIAYATTQGFQTDGVYILIGDSYYLIFRKTGLDVYQEETRVLQNMFKYHNLEKKYLIKNYANKKSVLDLGAGFGGDLVKYEEMGVSRLILVEPMKDNLLSLKSRLDTTAVIQYQTTLVQAFGQDWETIRPFIKDRVDVVSSFFSLTFLFESLSILRSFLHTVNESLIEGGMFIGTMMSGEKTYELLKSIPTGKTHTFGNEIIMTKLYENNTEPSTGMKLDIHINHSIVGFTADGRKPQIEYLAFFSILRRELESMGFSLVIQFDFQPTPKKLSPTEIEFSQLNIGFAFQKNPVRIPYETTLLSEDSSSEFLNLYGETQTMIRTGVRHPYSFYHSYLYSTEDSYRRATYSERDELAKDLYLSMVDYIEEKLPEKMTREYIQAFQEMTGVNVYWLDAVTRRPILLPGTDVTREYSVMMVQHESGEFEPLAFVLKDETVRMLVKINPYLMHLHRKRQ